MKAGDRMTFTLMPDGVVVFRVKNKSVMTLADRLHKKGRKAVPVEQLSRLPLWRPLGQQSLELLQHVRHAHGDDAGTRSATHCLRNLAQRSRTASTPASRSGSTPKRWREAISAASCRSFVSIGVRASCRASSSRRSCQRLK